MKPRSRRSRAPIASSDGGKDRSLALSSFLPYRLNCLSTAISEGLARIYGDRFGIGIPEWRVLATVGERRSITAKAVGEHARMSKVKVSRAAALLGARGLIRRVPNENDLREAFLELTASGERMYREITPLALAYADRLTAGFSASDRDTLEHLIDELLRRAEA